MINSSKRNIVAAAVITAVTSLIALGDPSYFVGIFEDMTIGLREEYAGNAIPPPDDMLLIVISDTTVQRLSPALGTPPWPRSTYAPLIRRLAQEGSSVIALDMAFAGNHGILKLTDSRLRELAEAALNASRDSDRRALSAAILNMSDVSSDSMLAEATRFAGRVVHQVALNPAVRSGAVEDELSMRDTSMLEKFQIKSVLDPRIPVVKEFEADIPELIRNSAGVGAASFARVERAVPGIFPLVAIGDSSFVIPSFALAAVLVSEGISSGDVRLSRDRLFVGSHAWPLNEDLSLLVPLNGITRKGDAGASDPCLRAARNFHTVAFEDALAWSRGESGSAMMPRECKGRMVLIGFALSQKGHISSRLAIPTILMNARVIDSLRKNRTLRETNLTGRAILLPLVAAIPAFATLMMTPLWGAAACLALIVSAIGIGWAAYPEGLLTPVGSIAFAAALSFFTTYGYRHFRDKREIHNAFGKYVAGSVLKEILRDPSTLKLGGTRKRATILFADIVGFSTISELLPPEQISEMLNAFMTEMTRCVIDAEGTVDKFIGDALMAEWNLPTERSDHTVGACLCALRQAEQVLGMKSKWTAKEMPPMSLRVGIHTGIVIAGNMGSEKIFDYTVIGASVNTASRLEALNKDFGTIIMISGETKSELDTHRPGHFRTRFIARAVLKGQSKPIDVYELIGDGADVAADSLAWLSHFELGVELWIRGDFTQAREAFDHALALNPHDGPSNKYKKLCDWHTEHPPVSEWPGLYYQEAK